MKIKTQHLRAKQPKDRLTEGQVQKFRRKGWNLIQPEKELQKDESQIKTNKV